MLYRQSRNSNAKEPHPSILAFGPGVWKYPEFCGSPRYHLWTLAGLGWRILYVEPPTKFRARNKIWSAPDREFHVLSPGRVAPFSVRMTSGESLAAGWRDVTAKQLVNRGLKAARGLHFDPDVFWFGAPWHAALSFQLPLDKLHVCHVYDDLPLSPTLSSDQRQLLWAWERELLRRMHIVFCSSVPQMERRQGMGERTVLLENAVAPKFLPENRGKPPDDVVPLIERIKSLPEPRFVYGGVADDRLEPAYFQALGESFPIGSFVFLGKVDKRIDRALEAWLDSSANAHLFGSVPYHAFPYLYEHASVLLIPHKRSPFTDAMYPEKLNEYLASGKPIVAVAMPEIGRVAREAPWPNVIYVVNSPMDFVSAASMALGDQNRTLSQNRIEMARARTWDTAGIRLDNELRISLRREKGTPGPSAGNPTFSPLI